MESLIISPKEKLSVIMNVLSLVNMFRSVSIEYPKRDSFAWQGLLVSFPQLLCILYSIHFTDCGVSYIRHESLQGMFLISS